jgi:hypothetical protein
LSFPGALSVIVASVAPAAPLPGLCMTGLTRATPCSGSVFVRE